VNKFNPASMYFALLAYLLVRSVMGLVTMVFFYYRRDVALMVNPSTLMSIISIGSYALTMVFLVLYILTGANRTAVLVCVILTAVWLFIPMGYTLVTMPANHGYMLTSITADLVFFGFSIWFAHSLLKNDDRIG